MDWIFKSAVQIRYQWDGHLGWVQATQDRIELSPKHTRPIDSKSYRAGPKVPKLEIYEITKNLELKLIDRTHAERLLTFIFELEMDKALRFCVDYRKCHADFVAHFHPVHQIGKLFESSGNSTVFLALHSSSSYQPVDMAKIYIEKTTLRHVIEHCSSFICPLNWRMHQAYFIMQ